MEYSFESEIAKMFSELHPVVIKTSGLQEGYLVKFRTFYLKMYYQSNNNSYEILGFLYDAESPKIHELVPRQNLYKYASKFTYDNFLIGMGDDWKC